MKKNYQTNGFQFFAIILPIIGIIISCFLILFALYNSYSLQAYDTAIKKQTSIQEMFDIACFICIVVSLFFVLKLFFESDIDNKLKFVENSITFLCMSCFLFSLCHWFFCLVHKCTHINCNPFSFFPALLCTIITVSFILQKKHYLMKSNTNFE